MTKLMKISPSFFSMFRNQGLPLSQKDHIDENSGNWEHVAIPVSSPSGLFSAYASYTLKNLAAGAVYDVIVRAKNRHGRSEWSKIFNFFNKGVGKSIGLAQIIFGSVTFIIITGLLSLIFDIHEIKRLPWALEGRPHE